MKSMNMLLGLGMIGLCITTNSTLAQETAASTAGAQSTVESKNLFQKLKDSPFDLSLNLETDTSRNDKTHIDGIDQLTRLMTSYKLSPNDKITNDMRLYQTKLSGQDVVNDFNRFVIKYTRSNLLTEAAHGAALSFSVEGRYLPNTVNRNNLNRYGHIRLGPTLAKNFGILSADIGVFWAHVVKRENNETFEAEDGTPLQSAKSNWYIPISQTLSFTDKLSLTLVEELFYNMTESDKSETFDLTLTTEVGYQFNDIFYVGVSAGTDAGSYPYKSKDGRKVHDSKEKPWHELLTYGINFNFNIF